MIIALLLLIILAGITIGIACDTLFDLDAPHIPAKTTEDYRYRVYATVPIKEEPVRRTIKIEHARIDPPIKRR